jgi:hypothetical protein
MFPVQAKYKIHHSQDVDAKLSAEPFVRERACVPCCEDCDEIVNSNVELIELEDLSDLESLLFGDAQKDSRSVSSIGLINLSSNYLPCDEPEDPLLDMEIYLSNGGDPNGRTEYHGSLFQKFVVFGNVDVVKLLLRYGAKANIIELACTFGGNCPLNAAIAIGRIDLVELLVAHDACPEAACGPLGNILHAAAYLEY